MYKEVEDLGSSLLARGRETRKRTEKRYKKDVRNQAALQVVGKGVQLFNQAIKDRTNTFINEQEDLVGERLRYEATLKDRDAIITNYETSTAHAGGRKGYWAEQFAGEILTNLKLNFDEAKWDEDSMNLYAQAEGLKAAEEYLPKFEEAYQASLQMPDLGDYDAWVRTKDGRASNAGGWLFNRAERAITGKTQADVDNELIDAVINSRYGDAATKVSAFKNALEQGYGLRAAKKFGDLTPENLNIRPAGLKITSVERKEREVPYFDVTLKVPFNVIKGTMNGRPIIFEEAPYDIDPNTGEYIRDEEGKKTIEPQHLRNWNIMSRTAQGQDTLTESDNVTSVEDRVVVARPEGAPRVGKGEMWGQAGTWQTYKVIGERGELVERFEEFTPHTPDEELSLDQKISTLSEASITQMQGAITEASTMFTAGSSGFFGKVPSVLEGNVMGFYLAGDDVTADVMDELKRNEQLGTRATAEYQRLAVKAKELTVTTGLGTEETTKLIADAYIFSILTGMENSEYKAFSENENFLGFQNFENTILLAADAEREDVSVESVSIPPKEYSSILAGVIEEISYDKDDDMRTTLQKQRARDLIGNSQRFMSQEVTLIDTESGEPLTKLINELATTNHTVVDNKISMGNLVEHWNISATPPPPPPPPPVNTGLPNDNPYYDPTSDVFGEPEPLSYTFRGVMPWINKQLGIISGSRESVLKQQELTRLVRQIMETEDVSYEDAIFLVAKQLGGGEDEEK